MGRLAEPRSLPDLSGLAGLPDRLAEARGDLSIRELSRLLTRAGFPISDTMAGRYERGLSEPSAAYLGAFCLLCNVSPCWLLYGQDRECYGWGDGAGADAGPGRDQ